MVAYSTEFARGSRRASTPGTMCGWSAISILGQRFPSVSPSLRHSTANWCVIGRQPSGPLPPTAVAAEGAAGAWMARAQYFSMGQRHDYTAALTAIDAPTLIVHGSDDIQALAVSEMYRDAIQDARLVSIEGGGHFMHHTRPEEVATAIRERLTDAR